MLSVLSIHRLGPRVRVAITLFAAAAAIGPAATALARVKLITLPIRERVEIQLDNPAPRSSKKSESSRW